MTELSVQDWFEEINRGLEYRRLYGNEASWAECEALFYNVHGSNAHQAPNLIYSTGDALMSTMSVPYPYLTVKPRNQADIQGARLREQIDNELIDTMGMPDEVELGVLSAYLWGNAIYKVGFDSEFGWDPTLDFGALHQTPMGLTLSQFNRKKQRIEYNDIEPGMPWFKRVLPHDFVVPWGTGPSLSTAPWCAHRVIRHIDECRGDVKYSTRGLKPVMSIKDFVESYKKVPQVYRAGQDITQAPGWNESGDSEYVELWEIHDRRTQKIYVLATGNDSFLRNELDTLQLNGLPFLNFTLVPRARTFWTTSDAYYLRQSQNEAAEIALQASKHRKLSILRMLYDKDAIEPDALDDLLSAESGVGIPVETKGGAVSELVAWNQPPPDLQTAASMESVRRDSRELTGFSRNQMGEYEQTGRRTATEANAVAQASSLRMDRRQGLLSKLYINAFRKIDAITSTYWQIPRVAQLLGPDGAQQFITFTGDHLKGEYHYGLGFSLAPTETLQQRRQNALQMYTMLRQDPLMNPFGLARYLNLSFNDPEFSSMFNPGVLNGQIEALSAMQGNIPGGGNGMGTGPAGAQGAGAGGKPAQGQSSSANRPGSVSTAGAGARNTSGQSGF